jgi:predicted RNA methylase
MKIKMIKIGNAVLYCGDAFSIVPTLDMKLDAVISDPPFGLTNCKWDKRIPLDKFWEMIEAQTKQNANYVFFACGMFMVKLISSKSKWSRYEWIWQKCKKCGHLNLNPAIADSVFYFSCHFQYAQRYTLHRLCVIT